VYLVPRVDFAIYKKKALLQSKAVQPKAKEHQQLGCVRVCKFPEEMTVIKILVHKYKRENSHGCKFKKIITCPYACWTSTDLISNG
jgi:hypothetical protein